MLMTSSDPPLVFSQVISQFQQFGFNSSLLTVWCDSCGVVGRHWTQSKANWNQALACCESRLLSLRFLICAPVQCFPTGYFVTVHMENVFVQLSRVMEIPS